MKNLILLFFLMLPFVAKSQTIQEFYALFEHSNLKSLENTETNQVLIDEENAFIQIKDILMPLDVVRFKCFVGKDKSKIFGFQYVSAIMDSVLAVPRAEFYTYQKNGEWKEVTQQVCPQLTIADFWGKSTSPDKVLQEYNLELVMPQTGTTVLAKSTPAYDFQFDYSNMPRGYLEAFQKIKFKTIELNWNETKGKFEIGKKY